MSIIDIWRHLYINSLMIIIIISSSSSDQQTLINDVLLRFLVSHQLIQNWRLHKNICIGYKKAIYCVDSVSKDYSVEDLCSFVAGLTIKPRRCMYRHQAAATDRKAFKFRLCIREEDRRKLLDATVWPDSVTDSRCRNGSSWMAIAKPQSSINWRRCCLPQLVPTLQQLLLSILPPTSSLRMWMLNVDWQWCHFGNRQRTPWRRTVPCEK